MRGAREPEAKTLVNIFFFEGAAIVGPIGDVEPVHEGIVRRVEERLRQKVVLGQIPQRVGDAREHAYAEDRFQKTVDSAPVARHRDVHRLCETHSI